MKNKIFPSLIGTSLALAMAVAVWSPANTSAQVKGATLLMSQPAAPTPVAAVASPAMACAKCTTQYTGRVDASVRGAIKPIAITANNLCPSCDTVSKTVGVGRSAMTVTTRTCTMDGAKLATCCN